MDSLQSANVQHTDIFVFKNCLLKGMHPLWCYPIAAHIKMDQTMGNSESFWQFNYPFIPQIILTELKSRQPVDATATILDKQAREILCKGKTKPHSLQSDFPVDAILLEKLLKLNELWTLFWSWLLRQFIVFLLMYE